MIGGMTHFEFLLSFAATIIALTGVMGLMFFMLQKKKESRYDDERKKIELDLLRHNVESQIYGLNERFTKNKDKWADANHLQIDGNTKLADGTSPKKSSITSFLAAAGITENDLKEEQFVFILTPFHDKYDDVFETIKKVCAQSDIKCIRGDEQNFKSDIFTHVLKNIVKSKLVIANLSGRNPNVMYELGIAHALDKTTIMVSMLLDELPVDIKSKRIVTYKTVIDLEDSLKTELLKVLAKS